MKLEKASVSLISLVSILGVAVAGSMWMGAMAGDVADNKKAIAPITKDIADIKTEQAVNGERLRNLEESVKELKQDQKDGFKSILDKLDKRD